jgi:hypothetical protein
VIDSGVQVAFDFFGLGLLVCFGAYLLAGFISFMKRMLG